MKIFLSIISDGCYDDHDSFVLYAGTDEDTAIKKCKEHQPIFDCSYAAYVEVWKNGIKIKVIEVSELNL